jgi:hypothetical protein
MLDNNHFGPVIHCQVIKSPLSQVSSYSMVSYGIDRQTVAHDAQRDRGSGSQVLGLTLCVCILLIIHLLFASPDMLRYLSFKFTFVRPSNCRSRQECVSTACAIMKHENR